MTFKFEGSIWNYKKECGNNAGFKIHKVEDGFLHISFWKWCCNIHYRSLNNEPNKTTD